MLPKLKLLASNFKIGKSAKIGVIQAGLSLAPADLSGRNVCPNASEGCKAACLFYAGRGAMGNVAKGRIARTQRFFTNREEFLADLFSDLQKMRQFGRQRKRKIAIRLNVISDLPWESIKYQGKNFMEHFPRIQFLDYTKSERRMMQFVSGDWPANYHLTFSRSESNENAAKRVLKAGGNVCVVFGAEKQKRTFGLPETFWGVNVVDGDIHDARFKDGVGVVVGVRAKGRASKDTSGFVVTAN